MAAVEKALDLVRRWKKMNDENVGADAPERPTTSSVRSDDGWQKGWTDTPSEPVIVRQVDRSNVEVHPPTPQAPVREATPRDEGLWETDPVESPNYYCKDGIELGEVLYVWGLPHRRASAVEYIMRAGDKDPDKEVEDLRKAIRNLEMEIAYMERYGRRGRQ